jgi:hypothetical protein
MPGDGNATAACLLIGRQEKGDRDSAVTVVVHHLGEHGGTVLPAPAVGIRTSRWFDEGGQAERLDGTESGENRRTPTGRPGRGGSTRCPRGDTVHTHTPTPQPALAFIGLAIE